MRRCQRRAFFSSGPFGWSDGITSSRSRTFSQLSYFNALQWLSCTQRLSLHARKLFEDCHEHIFHQLILSVSIVGIHMILIPQRRCSPCHFDSPILHLCNCIQVSDPIAFVPSFNYKYIQQYLLVIKGGDESNWISNSIFMMSPREVLCSYYRDTTIYHESLINSTSMLLSSLVVIPRPTAHELFPLFLSFTFALDRTDKQASKGEHKPRTASAEIETESNKGPTNRPRARVAARRDTLTY